MALDPEALLREAEEGVENLDEVAGPAASVAAAAAAPAAAAAYNQAHRELDHLNRGMAMNCFRRVWQQA